CEHLRSNYSEIPLFKYLGNKEQIENFIFHGKYETVNEIKYPSQKWHLFVSYIAYQELNAEKSSLKLGQTKKVKASDFESTVFDYYNRCVCPELMLWMAETALGSKSDKVIKAYQDAEALSNKRGSTICATIRKNIPWKDIQLRITDKHQL
ncbi:MAG: hypothetical protein LUF26_00155, partial [Firmicutes bacterium]|nr:hypothetical protein [Bacillota bacterium]